MLSYSLVVSSCPFLLFFFLLFFLLFREEEGLKQRNELDEEHCQPRGMVTDLGERNVCLEPHQLRFHLVQRNIEVGLHVGFWNLS